MVAGKPRLRDLIALVGANVALAIGPWLVRSADVGPVAAAFWRMALALPLLIFLALYLSGDRGVRPAPRHGLWLAMAGVFFAADLACWHIGIMQTKLANATLLGNTASLLFPIYGFIAMRRWPTRMQGLALVLATLGAMMLMGRSYELSPRHLAGDLFSLAAGICYTFYLVGIGKARGDMEQWTVLAWSTAASVLPLWFAAVLMGEQVWPGDWSALIALAFMSQIVGQGLLVLSLGRLSPLIIGLTFLIQPFVSAVIGWLVYQERLATADWIGAGLVGLALILVRQPDRT